MDLSIFIWIVASLFLSLLIGRFFIKKVNKFSLKKTNTNGIRFSSQTKPIYGGVLMYVVFVLSAVYSLIICKSNANYHYLLAFLLTATIGFSIGLADDLLSPSPLFKFFGQCLVALTLTIMGVAINITDIHALNIVLTFILVIGFMNSINLLDNMDAISASVSTLFFIAILTLFLLSDNVNLPMIILLSGTIGSLLGFLRFNWNPSKMYMGDNGSQFLGAILSVATIIVFWNRGLQVEINFQKSFWATILAFIVPITDTTTVFINRISKGQSPFVGGRDHTTHHLYYLGLSVKQVALVLDGATAISLALSVYIVRFVEQWTNMHTIGFGTYSIIVFALIYSTTKISKPKKS